VAVALDASDPEFVSYNDGDFKYPKEKSKNKTKDNQNNKTTKLNNLISDEELSLGFKI